MRRDLSPLRYPGGKQRFMPEVLEVVRRYQTKDMIYVEPYAGGAGVALQLLMLEHVEKIVINDLDYGVYCFWRSVISAPGYLCAKIDAVSISVETWSRQKAILADPPKHSEQSVGFAFLFVNRCNYSGIMRARPIGGMAQSGKYRIGDRFNKAVLIDRIKTISAYCNRIEVRNQDAIELMEQMAGENIFFYLDPPYWAAGKRLYKHYYQAADHRRLAQYLQKIKTPWMLTYDNTDEIKKLYEGCPRGMIENLYTVSVVRRVREVMFQSMPKGVG